jgi:hypothetical protein
MGIDCLYFFIFVDLNGHNLFIREMSPAKRKFNPMIQLDKFTRNGLNAMPLMRSEKITTLYFKWFQDHINRQRDAIKIHPGIGLPSCPNQKNPGPLTLIIRERTVDGKPLILTGENGRTKKRKIINKGEKDDFQKNKSTRLFFQFASSIDQRREK